MTCQHSDIGLGRKLTTGGILCYDEEGREGGEARRGGGGGMSVVAAFTRASMAGEEEDKHKAITLIIHPASRSGNLRRSSNSGLPVPPSPISIRQIRSQLVPRLGIH